MYALTDFFKFLAPKIDITDQRWTFEAKSNDRDFSFVCKTLVDDGYINIYGRDITVLKQNQQELEKLSYIVQHTTNAVIITDAIGKVEWVNDAFTNITGYTLQEVKGKTPGSVLQGKDTNQSTVAAIREKIRNGEAFTNEIFNYKKTGETYWLRINAQPIHDKAGNLIRFFAIEEDITKEKAAEQKLKEFDERLHLAMQKMGDNVWEHDFLTKQTSFSQKEFELLGYQADEHNSNVDLWYNCVHPDDKRNLKENDISYRRGLIANHSLEYRIIDKKGVIKWVLDRGVVIEKRPDGTPLRIIGTHTDITEKKAIEKALEESASRMSSLITNLQSGIMLENEDRTISLINKRFCELFSMSIGASELIGMDCGVATEQAKHKFLYPDEYMVRVNEIFNERETVIGDKLELANGKIFERNFIPIWNQDVYAGALWMFNDITEKLNAEKKLEDVRVFYEEILDNIPSDIAVFDTDHRYLYLNPKSVEDENLRKWMIGKKDEDYVAILNLPQSFSEKRRSIFIKALSTKSLVSWEEEVKKPDSSFVYNLRHVHPVLNNNNDIKLFIGYGLDITNIKNIQKQIEQSEKSYRDLINNSMAIITTHDLDGRFLAVNPMVSKVYGYSDEEMIGHQITEFMLPEDRTMFSSEYLDKIKTEKRATGILRVVHKNGDLIYNLYNNFLKEEQDKPPYIIGFSVDITDRIKAEKELKLAKKITEDLAKTKQNFLANMSHEIRTPMNAIMGMANQLGKTKLDSNQQFYLNTINSASDNLLVIINDILDLSKIEAGKLSFESIGFEPKMVISNAMQVLSHRAAEKGIQLTNSYFDATTAKILIGDPYRINQVMLNLIGNAIKFTERGSVDITLKVITDNELSQVIQFDIKDSGIGMEEKFVRHLFDKFSQEYESVSRKYGGTGLGMSICKDLVELMGGKISAQSIKGQGTCISFAIEFKKGTHSDMLVKESIEFEKNFLSGKTILIVDDNDMNRLVASIIIKAYGATIIEAVNGQEAVEKTFSSKPDIVLMDLQMPTMNGFEATAAIRAKESKIPIIALTANAIKGENDKCFAAGMNDFVPKPFKEEFLLKTIAKWLGNEAGIIKNKVAEVIVETDELYDLSSLRTMSGGNEVFIKKMLTIFCQQTPQMVIDMVEAHEQKDLEKVAAMAHKIKPSIDNLNINILKQVVRDIEIAGKENRNTEALAEDIATFKTIIGKTIAKMHQEFPDLG